MGKLAVSTISPTRSRSLSPTNYERDANLRLQTNSSLSSATSGSELYDNVTTMWQKKFQEELSGVYAAQISEAIQHERMDGRDECERRGSSRQRRDESRPRQRRDVSRPRQRREVSDDSSSDDSSSDDSEYSDDSDDSSTDSSDSSDDERNIREEEREQQQYRRIARQVNNKDVRRGGRQGSGGNEHLNRDRELAAARLRRKIEAEKQAAIARRKERDRPAGRQQVRRIGVRDEYERKGLRNDDIQKIEQQRRNRSEHFKRQRELASGRQRKMIDAREQTGKAGGVGRMDGGERRSGPRSRQNDYDDDYDEGNLLEEIVDTMLNACNAFTVAICNCVRGIPRRRRSYKRRRRR